MRNQALHPRTVIINKDQKNQAKLARLNALAWLAKVFPKAFDTVSNIQPLKLGIMEDILIHAEEAKAAGISKSKLREAVVIFTRRIDYLACLKAQEMRIDLLGCPVVSVTPEEAELASLKIKKRVEKSAKNARNKLSTKPKAWVNTKFAEPIQNVVAKKPVSYLDRNRDDFLDDQGCGVSNKPAVTVKRKSSRAFDPEAVLRLKEKLGLSRKDHSFEKIPD
jgi:ProP effector